MRKPIEFIFDRRQLPPVWKLYYKSRTSHGLMVLGMADPKTGKAFINLPTIRTWRKLYYTINHEVLHIAGGCSSEWVIDRMMGGRL